MEKSQLEQCAKEKEVERCLPAIRHYVLTHYSQSILESLPDLFRLGVKLRLVKELNQFRRCRNWVEHNDSHILV